MLGGRGLVLVWACSAGTQKPNAFNMFEIHFISIKFCKTAFKFFQSFSPSLLALYVKVFRAIACLYGFGIWDKCRLQIGRLIGKRGKHCCEMIYQLDSLSLNFKSSKSLVFGIGNLLQYFTTMFNLIYLPACKSAVCLCRTLLWL